MADYGSPLGKRNTAYINGGSEPITRQVGHDASDGACPDEPLIRERAFRLYGGWRFVNSYFAGSRTSAIAALLQGVTLTDEQIQELGEILEKSKEQAQERGRKK